MSRTKIMGRFSATGFTIGEELGSNGVYCRSGEKKGTPLDHQYATYGPLIHLLRVGQNGKLLKIYKLRTMYAYSEFIQEYVYAHNHLAAGGKISGDHQDKPDKEAGTPGRPSNPKSGDGKSGKPQQREGAVYAQSVAALGRLKAMYEATSDPDEKKILSQQIAVVRNRIAAVERTMDAGQIQPDNRTKEREVSMSETYRLAFPDLAHTASKFSREDDFYIHVGTVGTVGQQAELKALIAQHGQRAHNIVKGWLK